MKCIYFRSQSACHPNIMPKTKPRETFSYKLFTVCETAEHRRLCSRYLYERRKRKALKTYPNADCRRHSRRRRREKRNNQQNIPAKRKLGAFLNNSLVFILAFVFRRSFNSMFIISASSSSLNRIAKKVEEYRRCRTCREGKHILFDFSSYYAEQR